MGTNHDAKVEEEVKANYTPKPLPGFTLVGEDGNAFSIMGRFKSAARRAKVPSDVISGIITEAMSSDYNALLRVFIPWCEDGDEEDMESFLEDEE